MGACISTAATGDSSKTQNAKQPEEQATTSKSTNNDRCVPITPGRDLQGNENIGAELDRNTMEELDYVQTEPTSLQEELNEVMEAMFSYISEEEIQAYQRLLKGMEKQQIAERAAKANSRAPDFTLLDQDSEPVTLSRLVQKGPVVLQFYRGKWCPQCNLGLMKYQEYLHQIQARGATLLAISPMLPDGTQYLASKRDLQFTVASDCGNTVAKQYNVTFVVPESVRPNLADWGGDLPKVNGNDLWELPLAATYIIDQQQQIVWSFLDNNFGIWAEPRDVVQALDRCCGGYGESKEDAMEEPVNTNGQTRGFGQIPCVRTKNKTVFGRDKLSAREHVARYKIRS